MKKIILLLATIILTTNLFAVDYIVSGAGSSWVNGTYTESGTYNDHPKYVLSGTYYIQYNSYNSRWIICDDMGDTYYYASSTESTPPSSGWTVDMMGNSPAPSVSINAPAISYSTSVFQESSANNGSIDNSITITSNNNGGLTFTGSNGDDFVTGGKVAVGNLPSGLTATITKVNDLTLTAVLSGNAANHNNANDVLNLTFTFQNSAFSSGDASSVYNSTKSNLAVNFCQVINIASSGGDFTTISSALASSGDGDVLNLAAEIFTEQGLSVNHNIVIQGQGAAVTIVQANATYNTATDRVFSVANGKTVTIKNISVRNGKLTGNWNNGSGINNLGSLTLLNVWIYDNVNGCYGGGIYSTGNLEITNCTINDNSASAYGGGVAQLYTGTLTISNSTFINNATPDYSNGAAIYVMTSSINIINSTICNNSNNGLSLNGGVLTIYNTILANNTNYDYYVRSFTTITDNGYNIVESQGYEGSPSNWKFSNTTDILYNYQANGTAGTSWNRNNSVIANQNLNISSTLAESNTKNGTQTLALSSGSFAIDAGTDTDAPETDQRGFYTNGTKDIGAYEYNGLESPPATAPTEQPTNLIFTNSGSNPYNVKLSFTASASAEKYLVVRKTGSTPTFSPSDGTEYSSGSQGDDYVVYSGTNTSATDANVAENTYYYKIFAFNGSGAATKYLTTNPLSGYTIISFDGTTSVENTGGNPVSAGFPNAGVNITFPDGTGGTDLTVSKTASTPASNFAALPGVKGVKNLYFTITSSNASPGAYTLVLDFSSLVVSDWTKFKIMKRTDANSAWKDITVAPFNAIIANRQTDGVWGKFTITGLTSFSEFAGGEAATTYTVTSAAEDAATNGTLKYCIANATAGDIIEFNTTSMGGNSITLTSPVIVDKNMTIRGIDGGIVLDGGDATRVMNISDGVVARLEKLKIQNASGGDGYGGGIYNLGDLTLVNCVVAENVDGGLTGAGGIYQDNDANNKMNLVNCTVTNNDGTDYFSTGIGGISAAGGTVNIYNTIIFGNTGDGYSDVDETTTITEAYNSCIGNLTALTTASKISAGSGNISSDPLFVTASGSAAHPYSIQGSSPCADAGNDSYCFETSDIKGDGRKLLKTNGSTTGNIDIGAYEFNSESPLPVELSAFTATVNKNTVTLNWRTTTEVDNYGFNVECRMNNAEWETIGFVEGSGNSNSTKEYSFTDNLALTHNLTLHYRLKQIDTDGLFTYSKEVEVNIENIPTEFALEQNYPNPFNPSTKISFALPSDGAVQLKIFNLLGQEIASLINEEKKAGNYTIDWNASNISTGVYIYQLNWKNQKLVKKMSLIK